MLSDHGDSGRMSESREVPNDHTKLTRSQAWNLYISHAFSTWNARGYEFAIASSESNDGTQRTSS